MRGWMSGPIWSDVSNCVLSLAAPPVRWKSRGLPSRSVLRWILVEKPPRERPNAWRCCPLLRRRPKRGRAPSCCRRTGPGCCLAAFGQHLEECLEHPGTAEPPEPLPYAVPFAIFTGERAPRYAVHCEVVDSLEEFMVIAPWLSPVRLRRIEHFQHDRPVALRHSRQHVRLPVTGHTVIRTKPDSGSRQKRMSGIPSTRPSITVANLRVL